MEIITKFLDNSGFNTPEIFYTTVYILFGILIVSFIVVVIWMIMDFYKSYKVQNQFNKSMKPGDKAQMLTQYGVREVEIISITGDEIKVSLDIIRGQLYPAGSFKKNKRGRYKRNM